MEKCADLWCAQNDYRLLRKGKIIARFGCGLSMILLILVFAPLVTTYVLNHYTESDSTVQLSDLGPIFGYMGLWTVWLFFVIISNIVTLVNLSKARIDSVKSTYNFIIFTCAVLGFGVGLIGILFIIKSRAMPQKDEKLNFNVDNFNSN